MEESHPTHWQLWEKHSARCFDFSRLLELYIFLVGQKRELRAAIQKECDTTKAIFNL